MRLWSDRSGALVLIATSTLMLVMGSVHAFSVFLQPLETSFSAARSDASLAYSLALVCLTVAVLFGHRLYTRWSPGRYIFGACLIAVLGVCVAAVGPSLFWVWIGYGVLFGGANGLGYGFSLQIAAQANPGREGVAMGTVTAAYAVGAAIAPMPLTLVLDQGGHAIGFFGLAGALLFVAPISAILIARADVRYQSAAPSHSQHHDRTFVSLLWIGYGGAVAAGLMVIGHAAGIVSAGGLATAAWVAPTLIAIFNMVGSFAGGLLVDRIRARFLVVGLPILSATMLLALFAAEAEIPVLVSIGMIGGIYGATIAIYPAVIAKAVGVRDGAMVYGRVFTAWGFFGLVAPWLAGFLYDRFGGYDTALLVASCLACVSACGGLALRNRLEPRRAVDPE